LKLIVRLLDVDDGQVLIDKLDVRKVLLEDLRSRVGYLPQNSVLFSGTLVSNLNLPADCETSEEVQKLLKAAQISEFVNENKDGLQMNITQGGKNVSGGERQRLSIARTLAKQAKIYLFDDIFSSLDFKTDANLRKSVFEYTKGSTVIIVSQRIGTIMSAKKIVVIDGGKVAGEGTHAKLMNECELYREMAESQLTRGEVWK
jgi:ATP-binding cassette subfamily B protein